MASNAFTSAGTKLSVTATAPATFDSTGYAALSFTEVGDLSDIGEIGPNRAVVTHNPVGDIETYKFKGSRNNGTQSLQGAYAPGDAGQAILIAAEASDDDYYFALELADFPDGTNTIVYYAAKVMSAPIGVGSVDTITTSTYNLEINGAIIIVPGSAS